MASLYILALGGPESLWTRISRELMYGWSILWKLLVAAAVLVIMIRLRVVISRERTLVRPMITEHFAIRKPRWRRRRSRRSVLILFANAVAGFVFGSYFGGDLLSFAHIDGWLQSIIVGSALSATFCLAACAQQQRESLRRQRTASCERTLGEWQLVDLPGPVPAQPLHICPSCEYNLTAVPSRRCPECGNAFTLDEAREAAQESDKSLRRIENWRYVRSLIMPISFLAFVAVVEARNQGILGMALSTLTFVLLIVLILVDRSWWPSRNSDYL